MQGPPVCLFHIPDFLPVLFRYDAVPEPFPDIVHCLQGRVQHVFRVEPVVSQLVHDYLVCGEIVAVPGVRAYFVHSQEECRLAELVAVRPVFQMPYRAYRENRFPSAVPCDMLEKPYGFVHRKPFPCKFLRVPFQAV